MRPLLLAVLLLAGCRPNDGGTQTPQAGERGQTTTADSAANALLERADAGRIQGDTAAPVWIVEVSDFQCPYCRMFHEETYPALQREFIRTGIVRLAFVNLPLQMHRNAQPAAEAAMCASAQGRFWPVQDAIFASQERWANIADPAPYFDSLVVAAGVNAAEFRDCIQSGTIRRLIAADVGRAAGVDIRSTPTFFVGDERLNGAAPIEAFRAAIQRARAARPPG
ncbi:MAG: thioredoxin domain-containing protein [Gemmatimonadaceae bacterium]